MERMFFLAVDPRYVPMKHKVWTDEGWTEKTNYVPAYVAETKWHCNTDHIYGKWEIATTYMEDGEEKNHDNHSFLIRFYCDLDMENRQALADWFQEETKRFKNHFEND